jgi:hypothetical protein
MAHYQLTHLDLSNRLDLTMRMLNPDRPWGTVTQLAEANGVSRKFLYALQGQGMQALAEALLPCAPGRKAERATIVVDEVFIQRAIAACLTLLPGTLRPIQSLLTVLFGVHRSTGFLCQTAQALGERAQTYQQNLHFSLQALAEADEIFQGRHPCLTVVDGRSFLVLHLSAAAHRDAISWGCALLDVQQQGVQLLDLASDGGKGIHAGVTEAQLTIPLPPDLFHLLREAHQVTRRLEKNALHAMEITQRTRNAQADRQLPPHRGRPWAVTSQLPQAEADEQQALTQLSGWEFLLQEIRRALEPWDAQGYLTHPAHVRQTLLTAIDLLHCLEPTTIHAFADGLLDKLDELLAPLEWLAERLAPYRSQLDAPTQACLVWAWLHQSELGLAAHQILAPDQTSLVSAFWEALNLFHRSSSLAESLHSWLRPYLQVHRGMPDWLLPLLQLLWNHHAFSRGKRQGSSPMALAGISDPLTLSQLFDRLVQDPKALPAMA